MCWIIDNKGNGMVKYKPTNENIALLSTIEAAKQFVKDMNPISIWKDFYVIDWNEIKPIKHEIK